MEDKKRTVVFLSKATIKAMKEEAARIDGCKSDVVRVALTEYFERRGHSPSKRRPEVAATT